MEIDPADIKPCQREAPRAKHGFQRYREASRSRQRPDGDHIGQSWTKSDSADPIIMNFAVRELDVT
jgi:hypothetical protein